MVSGFELSNLFRDMLLKLHISTLSCYGTYQFNFIDGMKYIMKLDFKDYLAAPKLDLLERPVEPAFHLAKVRYHTG